MMKQKNVFVLLFFALYVIFGSPNVKRYIYIILVFGGK